MPTGSALEPGTNYGIPAKTATSTSLWAHLLRKDTVGQSTKSANVLPPITPLDKNGTSMRILLHDTQAHLDNFAARADTLFTGVDEAKREISIVNTLFQREHETLTEELTDLVNRSQTRLQNFIGTPAQAEQLGRLSKDINVHLEALGQRMDTIQSYNQSHSQLVQIQSQAIQSLQEQHGTILAAVLPILPLLQALPLHIDSARHTLTDLLTNPESSRRIGHTGQDCGRSSTNQKRLRNKRSSSTLRPSDSSPSPSIRKKARISATLNDNVLSKMYSRNLPETVQVQRTQTKFGSSLRSCTPVSASVSSLTRQETTIMHSPEFNSPTSPTLLGPKFNNESRPLAETRNDLTGASHAASPSSVYFSNGDSTVQHLHSYPKSSSLRSLLDEDSPKGVESPPSSLAPSPQVASITPSRNVLTESGPTSHCQMQTAQISRELPSAVASPRPFNSTEFWSGSKNKTSLLFIGSMCHQAQRSASRTPSSATSRHRLRSYVPGRDEGSTRPLPIPPASILRHRQGKTADLITRGLSITAATPTLASNAHVPRMTERRPPAKEGRRFIPLDDSDDDEDGNDDSDG